jgi:hypothetical protein
MTVDFYDGSNNDGLFNLLGKAFYAQQVINTALNTTIPTEVEDVIESFNLLTVDVDLTQHIDNLATSMVANRQGLSGLMSEVQSYCRGLLIEVVYQDVPLDSKAIKPALVELIAQMETNSESVDASTVGITVTAGGSNTSDAAIVTSTKRGDGLVQENSLAETITATAITTSRTATIQFKGESARSKLDPTWPGGSGARLSVVAVDANSSSLLSNGGMETEDTVDNQPDNWVVSVGVVGTTVKMTNVEVQTVAISGTPTGGHYLLHWVNADSKSQTTGPIAYNATSSTVQAALRSLEGLENVTVSSSGTTPNFTHTITFTGQGGNVSQLTSTDNMTGGTPAIAHATTTAGTAQVFYGSKALEFDATGSEQTTIQQRVTGLAPETAYAVHLWAIADVVPAAGVITIDLVDGIGGSVIADAAGTNNSITFNAADLTTSWQSLTDLVSGECVFRTPTVVPGLVYLRIRQSTAVSAGTSVFIDQVAFTSMSRLYPGGPYVAAFTGSTEIKAADTWSVAVTNDRAGGLQEWFNRNFDTANLGLLLPSDSGGSETIPDAVIG